MICPKCGKDVPDGMKYCPNCGMVLTGDEQTPTSQGSQVQTPYVPIPQPEVSSAAAPDRSGSGTGVILGIIALLLAAVIAVVVLFVYPGFLTDKKSPTSAELTEQAQLPEPEAVRDSEAEKQPAEEITEAEPEKELTEEISEEVVEEEERTSLEIKAVSVYDEADLLSSAEEKSLSDIIMSCERGTGWKFLFVTAEGIAENGTDLYAEDRYDDLYGAGTDGMILLIDMDNRMIWISSFGEAERYLSAEKIDSILTLADDNLRDEEYGDAASQVIAACAETKLFDGEETVE